MVKRVDYNSVNQVDLKRKIRGDKIKLRRLEQKKGKNKWYKVEREIFNLPSVNIELGGKVVLNSLLDTGSTVNLMRKEVYEELKTKGKVRHFSESQVKCVTATNENMTIYGECEVSLKINNKSWYVQFLIVNELTWKVILGVNFIEKTGMVINISERKIYFKFKPSERIEMSNQVNSVTVLTKKGEELKIGCEEMKDDIVSLVNSFPTVFTKEIGAALNFEHELKVKNDKPVNLRPYPVSPPKLPKMREITDELLSKGIIERSFSSYSSPSFLVKKPGSDDYRLVINYSEVNKNLEEVNVSIGDFQGNIHYLQGAEIFSVFDLNSAYYQVKLADKCKHITGFSTPYGQFRFNRVPFGINCGAGLLSGYLDKILGDIKFRYVINYLDDLIIYSRTMAEHLDHLNEVMKRLKANNLTVNPTKVMFAAKEISYVGFLVSKNSIKIDPNRTKAIRECKAPTNAKQVSRFIGMVSYFSKYINNYATIASPLNDLRRKKTRFKWTEECQVSFDTLKSCITHPPILRMADFDKEFILQCDASNVGCGSCLYQEYEGVRYPIAYYSKKFTDAERQNSVYEKEALGVVHSIEKFRTFLEVRPFLLEVDNQALSWVLSHHRKLGKIARWVEKILSLPFRVKHVKSSDNKVADFLSRLYENDNGEAIQTEPWLEEGEIAKNSVHLITDYPMAFQDFKEYQQKDDNLQIIIHQLKEGKEVDNYYLNKGVLMYSGKNPRGGKIVLPRELIQMVLSYYHVSFGSHQSYFKTLNRVRDSFYWSKLASDVKTFTKECEVCFKSKAAHKVYKGEVVSKHSERPMNKLYIDLTGELPRTTNGYKVILIAVDDFSKYTWLIPLRDSKAPSVSKALETVVFKNYSCCEIIVSDQGKQFKSHEFKNLCFRYGIKHVLLVTYSPQGNISERYIRSTKQALVAYHHHANNRWDSRLHLIQLALNTARSEVHLKTPFELIHTYKPNHGLSNLWHIKDLIDDKRNEQETKECFDQAIRNIKLASEKTILRRRAKNENTHPFRLDSVVYVKTHFISKKVDNFTKKLQFKWEGPYRIIYFLSEVTVLLQSTKDRKVVKRAHISQLKLRK